MTGMEPPVEVHYAGVVIARATDVRELEGGCFLQLAEPMPVGTIVGLAPEAAPARVTKVVESAEPGAAGMVVELL